MITVKGRKRRGRGIGGNGEEGNDNSVEKKNPNKK